MNGNVVTLNELNSFTCKFKIHASELCIFTPCNCDLIRLHIFANLQMNKKMLRTIAGKHIQHWHYVPLCKMKTKCMYFTQCSMHNCNGQYISRWFYLFVSLFHACPCSSPCNVSMRSIPNPRIKHIDVYYTFAKTSTLPYSPQLVG